MMVKGKGLREFEVKKTGHILLWFGEKYPTFIIKDDLESLYKIVEESKKIRGLK